MAAAERMTAESRWSVLESLRSQHLDRARKCAEVTIPTLVPPEGHSASTVYSTPYQSMGARGVNILSNKVLLAILPPNSPFFKFSLDDYQAEELAKKEGARAEIEEALSRVERSVVAHIEATAIRSGCFELVKQLLVAGNFLAYFPPEGGMRGFRFDQYVVKRAPNGEVLEIIVRENVSPMTLPASIQALAMKDAKNDDPGSPENTIYLFTYIRRFRNGYKITQEVKGEVVPDSQGFYTAENMPWKALRFIKVDGEDYGRSYVEEYLGDLLSLEGLSQAIVEAAAVSAKVVFLVKPNGVTSQRDITKAKSGDVKTGNAEDVTTLQVEKGADLAVANQTIARIEQRLAQAFLMTSAIQRNAERVTAEEIRVMASELEDALGGFYSTFSRDFQLSMVQTVMWRMTQQKRLPKLPKFVRPQITTGLEALGRGQDRNRLLSFAGIINQTFGPGAIAQYINVGDFIKRIGTSEGLDMKGLVKTDQQVLQDQQRAAMAEAAKAAVPGTMDMMREGVRAVAQQGTSEQAEPTAG